MISCYVTELGKGTPELLVFVVIPRLGELVMLPGRDVDFEVDSIRHLAQKSAGRVHPTVYVYLTIRSSATAKSAQK
jgi:hypothetical protein